MREFLRRLKACNSSAQGRSLIYVPYDQLSDGIGPLARRDPGELAIVLIENPEKAGRRPYHKQKLAWILCQQRQFALEQAERGVAVLYRVGGYAEVLRGLDFAVQRPAERELRAELAELNYEELAHEGWLTQAGDLEGEPPWRMDKFYRGVRRRTGILMEKGKPVGGRFSFDGENRERWRGEPEAPSPPRFAVGWLKSEVEALIQDNFGHHPGELDMGTIPNTLSEIEEYWNWVKERCMPWFGPYEDAMSVQSAHLFHSRLSPLINLHRILPLRILNEVLELDIPLNCKEGFVRQLLGWREFVHHVHERSDGFRALLADESERAGDGGYSGWAGQEWPGSGPGGALPNALHSERSLPPAYWGVESGLRCLDTVVASVWREGYSHHITRLMVLSNIATLLDVSPRELTDWFWVAYIDAYDWVVEPNVLAMGTFGVGDLMTTKPYVCGTAYIHRMSDYCGGCRFSPTRDCPLTALYWAFLERKRERLSESSRVDPVLRAVERRAPELKEADREVFERVSAVLGRGEALAPEGWWPGF